LLIWWWNLSSVIFETNIFPRISYILEFYNPQYAVCFVIEMALQHISSHDKPKVQAMCHTPWSSCIFKSRLPCTVYTSSIPEIQRFLSVLHIMLLPSLTFMRDSYHLMWNKRVEQVQHLLCIMYKKLNILNIHFLKALDGQCTSTLRIFAKYWPTFM